ncbi:alpha,alpha-trehalose-phosphate synthase (UDP-forming) [Luteimonas sp. MJ246]|uniref:alpha,alpha-trehalose-phosphate synthase (UDP-forming) n=1 Tax=Luteimonas sp. MJ174 TaxID=3129237 RepID=UPI0031BBC91F
MARLVVVSNRVTLPDEDRAGGLAIALRAALAERGGLWFGWSGESAAATSGTMHEHADGGTRYSVMDLSAADFDAYYNGFANRTLWPLLHFRMDLVDYTRATYDGYRHVNVLFADRLVPELRADDVIWVHDYHLIPLAQRLRERGIGNRIGFFLHTPMPSSDLLAALPHHRELFAALASYDLVGFQTRRDLERFQDYVRLFGRGRVVEDGVMETANGRRFRGGAFPIGIDVPTIAGLAVRAMKRLPVRRLHESLGGRALAIGVDRLDYSKGLPERFRAFERHLERHPNQGGRITFLQIAPPSRSDVPEYRSLRRELETLSGHINSGHAVPDWTPVRYINRNFPHDVLAGFYRIADIALVTPMRDGMNLVAKEYVAAQDPADPGVLVLSRFAGAAQELHEALQVNPYDVDGVADTIAEAHAMPLDERRQRWRAMMDRIEGYDIHAWRRDFLETLTA